MSRAHICIYIYIYMLPPLENLPLKVLSRRIWLSDHEKFLTLRDPWYDIFPNLGFRVYRV